MADAAQTVDAAVLIDRAPFGAFPVRTIAPCALIAMLDGFDTQAIAFVAPRLARQWTVDVASFGPVFGASLLGLAVGALLFGPIGIVPRRA